MHNAKPGCKIYLDTFAGLIKAEYIKIENRIITARITARKNHVYNCNEIITIHCNQAFPRVCYHKSRRGPFCFYTTPYTWE